jgi:hypothetical protein
MKDKIIDSICDFDVDFANSVHFGHHECINDDSYLVSFENNFSQAMAKYLYPNIEEAQYSIRENLGRRYRSARITTEKGDWNRTRLGRLPLQSLIDILAKLKSSKDEG